MLQPTRTLAACSVAFSLALGACSDADPGGSSTKADPGAAEWIPVPVESVAKECGLDPALLERVNRTLERPWAAVRYGKLCHEYIPDGIDETEEVFSATKTLGALVTGIVAWETRDLPRSTRKTGPVSDLDRVDHWLDDFSFHPDAQVAHVLAMVGHNADLGYGEKVHSYDTIGTVQINRLSDVLNTAIAQDPDRLGANLEEFTQRHLYEPLGMRGSVWSAEKPDKIFAYSWESTVRDMARVGLLMLRDGVWSGKRVLAEDWVYKLTHPAFEDANTGYGYLTWMVANSNWSFGGILNEGKFQAPLDPCAPPALWNSYPHGISGAADCNYQGPYTCQQKFDVGVWYAAGALGQYIVGHKGLDLVLIVKDLGTESTASPTQLWEAVRPALVALDPRFEGDDQAFCEAYSRGEYAPDL